MLESFQYFRKEFYANKTLLSNKRLNNAIQNYSFEYIRGKFTIDPNHNIFENIQDSNLIIINLVNEDPKYFIISYKDTILFVELQSLEFLRLLFSFSNKPKILFLNKNKSKNTFDNNIRIEYEEILIHKTFEEEIEDFTFNIKYLIHSRIDRIIFENIWAYFILKAYNDLNKERIIDFMKNQDNYS